MPGFWRPFVGVDPARLDEAVGRVTRLAVEALADCDVADVCLVDPDGPVTLAGTDPVVDEIAAVRRSDFTGAPGYEVWERGVPVAIGAADRTTRWPVLARNQARLGISSILLTPVTVGGLTVGTLGLHTTHGGSFDDQRIAGLFAEQVAATLVSVEADAALLPVRELDAALTHRTVVEQAVGVLVAEHHCSPDDAFAMLVERSRHERRAIADVAAALLRAALPAPSSAVVPSSSPRDLPDRRVPRHGDATPRVERLLDAGPVTVLRLRRGGTIVWTSGAGEHLTGRRLDELVGLDAAAICHPDDYPQVFAAIKRLRAGDTPVATAFRVKHTDGSWRHLEGQLFLADDASDDVEAILTDVTRHAETQRNRVITTWMAVHEIRTPLATVSAVLSMLRDGTLDPDSEEGRSLIDRTVGVTDRLGRFTTRLLELERLELYANLGAVDPVPVADVVADAARTVTFDRGVVCTVIDDTAGQHLAVESDLLAHAATNLVANAAYFAPDDTTVTVTTTAVPDRVTVTVRDHGCGVASEDRESIFEPFHQVRRDGHGTGLGLAIVARIAELHHGTVTVDTPDDGPGSVFTLTLRSAAPLPAAGI